MREGEGLSVPNGRIGLHMLRGMVTQQLGQAAISEWGEAIQQ